MALVLFLPCCWRVITQSLVALQCNMLRCFEDNFQVFLVLGLENVQIQWLSKLLRRSAIAVLQPPRPNIAATTMRKLLSFLSLAHHSPANALVLPMLTFPFKYSQILQPQMQNFSFFSENTCSLINPFHLTTMRQLSAKHLYYCFVRSTLWKSENVHNWHFPLRWQLLSAFLTAVVTKEKLKNIDWYIH